MMRVLERHGRVCATDYHALAEQSSAVRRSRRILKKLASKNVVMRKPQATRKRCQ